MFRALLFTVGLVGLSALGCTERPPSPTFDESTIKASEQYRLLIGAYNQAYRAKRRTPTAEDMKPFLKQNGDPDTLLKSPRDGKVLVIVPGFTPDTQAVGDERSIIMYEHTGVNGKRITIDVRGTM